MKILPEKTWLIITIASVIAAAISAAAVALSISSGSTIHTVISAVSLVLFIACAAEAWIIRSKILKTETIEEITCMRLKKAGIEKYDEEIVPKGKMPQE